MKNVFYFLITLIVVFTCGLLPALATIGIIETELWIISIWGSLCGIFSTIGAYWIGATMEGSATWNTQKFLSQLFGSVIGGILACLVFIF